MSRLEALRQRFYSPAGGGSDACDWGTRQVRFTCTSMEFTVAITGASGSIYAQRTLVHLAASGIVERVNLIMSGAARTVARVELGIDLRRIDNAKINEWIGLPNGSKLIHLQRLDNMAARPSSGSHQAGGNGDRTLLDGNTRCDCFGSRNKPDPSSRRCNSQGGTQTGTGASRDPLQCNSS